MFGATDAAYECVPLAALLWICRELSGQSERRIGRQRRLSSFEGRADREAQGFTVERPAHGETPNIEEVFHSTVRQGETNHRLGLLGDGRFRSIDTYASTWKVEQTRIIDGVGRRHDGIPRADIHLQRDANLPEHRHQRDAHAAVLLSLANGLHADGFGDERQTVFRRMDLAQRDEDPLQCLGGCVSESKQVDILRRPNRLTEPDEEECRTLQDEAVGELRLREAVQQTFASEPGQRELMLDVELVAPSGRAAPESRRRCSWGHPASQDDRFEIGLHDTLDAELLGDPVQLVHLETLAAPRFGKRLEGDVKADRVPEPEAVRDRAGDTVDFHALALDAMHLDAKIEQRGRDVDDPKWRRLEPRDAGAARDGDPDLMRKLRTDAVKAERRNQGTRPTAESRSLPSPGHGAPCAVASQQADTAQHQLCSSWPALTIRVSVPVWTPVAAVSFALRIARVRAISRTRRLAFRDICGILLTLICMCCHFTTCRGDPNRGRTKPQQGQAVETCQ